MAIVTEQIEASMGAETPFGHRWGGDVFHLATEHFLALQTGRTVALDVQNEYIAFLKCADDSTPGKEINTNFKGSGHGG
jgi:hypothetical protein